MVATARDAAGFGAAVHGALSTPETPMFANPWKMLAGEHFLRITELDDDIAAPVRREHRGLIRKLVGEQATATDHALASTIGPAMVIRGFDNSEILFRPDIDDRESLAADLIAFVQDRVRGGAAGALVFPFVRLADTTLRTVLQDLGFRHATLTAATEFDVCEHNSYQALLASMPSRRRRIFRHEQRRFDESGLRLSTVPPADTLDRLVDLELATARKYGGTPDRDRLMATRRAMVGLLGSAVRATPHLTTLPRTTSAESASPSKRSCPSWFAAPHSNHENSGCGRPTGIPMPASTPSSSSSATVRPAISTTSFPATRRRRDPDDRPPPQLQLLGTHSASRSAQTTVMDPPISWIS